MRATRTPRSPSISCIVNREAARTGLGTLGPHEDAVMRIMRYPVDKVVPLMDAAASRAYLDERQ